MSRKPEAPERSCGEAGDMLATVERLMYAGVANNDKGSLRRAKQLLEKVRPKGVADAYFRMRVADVKEELAAKKSRENSK